ncbi:hypothetical protein QJQ45_025823 [Haematococcus lacustris]|nr:hypothetical protein QJQ45_025823 [Haematococcus lacustris]
MLEGSDLPHNKLSQYLEHRLYYHLDKERKARAMKEGKLPCEVATAENLTIRVVNSVMKKCEVKPKFHEAFGPEGYPSEFPYRQRVVVLFQKIEGVDVCIFVMYVQEYGQDCAPPNQNCVYLSYLDSVKYFRPEISAVHPLAVPSMYALRTFVYHQILLGYLTYVKMLGFQQMYIWACPPMQGDDYILYCHPNKQKTPRSDRLRHWYLDMLRQAKNEGLVTQLTTLWDAYFPGGKDHRLERCSCAQVPYLEGDYWPGEAENQLANMAEGHRQAGKSSVSKGLGLAAARKGGKGKRYGPGQSTTDEQLMAQLGDILGGNMKEDFIVVHMQEVCTFCRTHILGGQRAFRYKTLNGMPLKCAPDRKFEGLDLKLGPGGHTPSGPITSLTLCENCFSAEHNTWISGARSARLPVNVTPNDLIPEKLEEVQLMKDTDPDVESEFFETRQSFLSLCQGNHYQFDTLRRAKHSSMMVLYHLHNPQAPAFAANCNLCAVEMEPGAGWRCTVCADFDICNKCKLEKGHAHPLQPQVNRKFDETQKRLTDAERRERTEQLQKTMALLVHACSCNNVQCSSSSCRKVRALFQHAVVCQLKVTGGCQMCKKMWFLLNLHAKSCNRSDCPVPRCRELKDLRRKQTARQEEQRRKAYQNMLRNQSQLQAQGK